MLKASSGNCVQPTNYKDSRYRRAQELDLGGDSGGSIEPPKLKQLASKTCKKYRVNKVNLKCNKFITIHNYS